VGLGRFYSSHGKLPGSTLNALYLAMGGLVGQQTTSWMVLLGALLLVIGVILAVAFVGTSWLEDRRFRRGSDSLARDAGSREPSTFLPPTPMAADPTLTDTRQQGRREPFSLSPGKLTRRPTTGDWGRSLVAVPMIPRSPATLGSVRSPVRMTSRRNSRLQEVTTLRLCDYEYGSLIAHVYQRLAFL
jgi:hypothetical protein